MHIHSGRISERECPDTPGVWEFKDNNKVKTTKVLGRDKQLSKSSKSQLKPETKEDDDDEWDKPLAQRPASMTSSCLALVPALPRARGACLAGRL